MSDTLADAQTVVSARVQDVPRSQRLIEGIGCFEHVFQVPYLRNLGGENSTDVPRPLFCAAQSTFH